MGLVSMSLQQGRFYRYVSGTASILFGIAGQLDLQGELVLFCLDDIIVIANARGTRALVFYPEKYLHLLEREDYHAGVAAYPIALYHDENGTPLMLWGAAWNRLHVIDLDRLL